MRIKRRAKSSELSSCKLSNTYLYSLQRSARRLERVPIIAALRLRVQRGVHLVRDHRDLKAIQLGAVGLKRRNGGLRLGEFHRKFRVAS